MEAGEEKSEGFYAVMGLKKDCSSADLRNAYKKLALKWHPDRCSASGNPKFVEEAKEKFQAIQKAYSVLSDCNKRFLYDMRVYDSDDDENGMDDFLGEMATMMSQTTPSEKNGKESFEELQELFMEMFQADMNETFGGPATTHHHASTNGCDRGFSSFSPASNSSTSNFSFCNWNTGSNTSNHKRDNPEMSSAKAGVFNSFDSGWAFCFGANDKENSSRGSGRGGGGGGSKRRNGRKQKVSSRHDVSSQDTEISAS